MKIESKKFETNLEDDYALEDFKGNYTILYFYPRDNTPGCTLEAKTFTSMKEDFAALDTKIVGVSKDSKRKHINFCEKQELDILLLSDPDEELCQHFEVIKEKKNYGKTYMGIERSTFILDEDLNIVKEYRKVRVKGHVEQVHEDLKELKTA
jgi:peroxiredoxin Q/BCP